VFFIRLKIDLNQKRNLIIFALNTFAQIFIIQVAAQPTAEEMEGKTLYQPEIDITPQEQKPVIKHKMADSKISAAIQAIKDGTYTLAQIIDAHELTEDQLARFNQELNIIDGDANEPV